jgi:hypothetical protein
MLGPRIVDGGFVNLVIPSGGFNVDPTGAAASQHLDAQYDRGPFTGAKSGLSDEWCSVDEFLRVYRRYG